MSSLSSWGKCKELKYCLYKKKLLLPQTHINSFTSTVSWLKHYILVFLINQLFTCFFKYGTFT